MVRVHIELNNYMFSGIQGVSCQQKGELMDSEDEAMEDSIMMGSTPSGQELDYSK